MKIVFIAIALICIGINLYRLIDDDENDSLKINGAIGWLCAIIWALMN